ncbi:MAG: hypothetical protein HIU86_08035 [Acidobacteria bacterium]|nr:hypothetical protein [Acidobacteriota bacterium]
MGLLVIGLFDVTRTVAAARDFGALMDAVFAQAGFGAYTRADVAQVIGVVVIAVNVAGLVIAIALAVPRLRTHRTAFWIPLVAGVGCLLVTTLLTIGAAVADPAFTARLSG